MAIEATTAGTAGQIRMDFMKLLVTQLQNQDPLEPLDNNEMVAQLSQLSSLEQLDNMNGTFQQVLASQQRLQATGLVGKEVDFLPEGQDDVVTGRVDSVRFFDDGIRLTIGEYEIDFSSVEAVRD